MAPVSYEIDHIISPIWSEASPSLRKVIVRLGVLYYIKLKIKDTIDCQEKKMNELEQNLDNIRKQIFHMDEHRLNLVNHLDRINKDLQEGDCVDNWGSSTDYVVNSKNIIYKQPLISNNVNMIDSYDSSLYSFE